MIEKFLSFFGKAGSAGQRNLSGTIPQTIPVAIAVTKRFLYRGNDNAKNSLFLARRKLKTD